MCRLLLVQKKLLLMLYRHLMTFCDLVGALASLFRYLKLHVFLVLI